MITYCIGDSLSRPVMLVAAPWLSFAIYTKWARLRSSHDSQAVPINFWYIQYMYMYIYITSSRICNPLQHFTILKTSVIQRVSLKLVGRLAADDLIFGFKVTMHTKWCTEGRQPCYIHMVESRKERYKYCITIIVYLRMQVVILVADNIILYQSSASNISSAQ